MDDNKINKICKYNNSKKTRNCKKIDICHVDKSESKNQNMETALICLAHSI